MPANLSPEYKTAEAAYRRTRDEMPAIPEEIEEALEERGYHVVVAKREAVADGIQSVRSLLYKCWFDKVGTADGVDCLENYRKKIDQRTNTFLEKPEHDEFSHGADAFRVMAYIYYDEISSSDPNFKAREKFFMNTPMGGGFANKRVKRMWG